MEKKISAEKEVANDKVDLKKDLDKNLHVEEPILKGLIDSFSFLYNTLIFEMYKKQEASFGLLRN